MEEIRYHDESEEKMWRKALFGMHIIMVISGVASWLLSGMTWMGIDNLSEIQVSIA